MQDQTGAEPSCVRTKAVEGAKHLRIAVLGCHGVGLTSIVEQICHGTADTADVTKKCIKIGNTYLDLIEVMNQTDTGAKRPTAPSVADKVAIKSADALILVFAIDDINSFKYIETLKDTIDDIKANNDTTAADMPIIVVGNKSDSLQREVDYAIADCIICIDWEMKYQEVSSATGKNIDAILYSLLKHNRLINLFQIRYPCRGRSCYKNWKTIAGQTLIPPQSPPEERSKGTVSRFLFGRRRNSNFQLRCSVNSDGEKDQMLEYPTLDYTSGSEQEFRKRCYSCDVNDSKYRQVNTNVMRKSSSNTEVKGEQGKRSWSSSISRYFHRY